MTNFEENIQQMFKGIDLCLREKLQFPTLSLIYTVIDNLAYIAYGDIGVGIKGTGTFFIKKTNSQNSNSSLLFLRYFF